MFRTRIAAGIVTLMILVGGVMVPQRVNANEQVIADATDEVILLIVQLIALLQEQIDALNTESEEPLQTFETLAVDIVIDDGVAEVTIEIDGEEEELTLDLFRTDDIVTELATLYNLSEDDIRDAMSIENPDEVAALDIIEEVGVFVAEVGVMVFAAELEGQDVTEAQELMNEIALLSADGFAALDDENYVLVIELTEEAESLARQALALVD